MGWQDSVVCGDDSVVGWEDPGHFLIFSFFCLLFSLFCGLGDFNNGLGGLSIGLGGFSSALGDS